MERNEYGYLYSSSKALVVAKRHYIGKTTIHQVVGIDGTTLIVFHTQAHCWQFPLISAGGAVCGERKIYYSTEAALKMGLK